jgi:hypothetical protein
MSIRPNPAVGDSIFRSGPTRIIFSTSPLQLAQRITGNVEIKIKYKYKTRVAEGGKAGR